MNIPLLLLVLATGANCVAHGISFNYQPVKTIQQDIAGYGMVFNLCVFVISLIFFLGGW